MAAALTPVACSSAPAPVTTATAPSLPPPAPSAAPPPPHLSDFVDLFPSTPVRDGATGQVSTTGVRFGRGLFLHQTHTAMGRSRVVCPLARTEGCSTFAFFPDPPGPASPPAADIWPPASLDTEITFTDDHAKPGPFAAPHAWVTFAGGRDAVYALREGGTHIDRIDDQGKVTLFASDEAMKDWDDLWVIELHGRTFVAGMNAGWRGTWYQGEDSVKSSWQLAELMPGTSGHARRLGPRTTLPMMVIPPRHNAQGARMVTRDDKLAAVRLPELVALPDEGDEKDRWAMVWLEVIPPDFNWPHGRPQKGVSRQPVASPANRPPKKGSRHSCGGPASRDLEDTSVTKRAHVTRFAGARLIDDEVRWTGARVGPVEDVRLAPHLDDGHLVVALPGARKKGTVEESTTFQWSGPTWAGGGSTIPLAHREEIAALVYEPRAHEGLVVMRDGDHDSYRRFDDAGRPIGEVLVASPRPQPVEQAALIDGKWMAIAGPHNAIYNLTDGGDELTRLKVPRGNWLRLVSIDGHGVLLHLTRDGLFSTPLDAQGVSSDPVKVDDLPENAQPDTFHVFSLGDTKAVSLLQLRGKDGHDRMAWRRLAPGATWEFVDLPSEEKLLPYRVSFHDLGGDVVVRFLEKKEEHFTWLRAGASVSQPVSEPPTNPHDAVSSGPLLGHGLWLTGKPGPLVHDDALTGLGSVCPHSVQTGPDTVVMACVHAPDPVVPQLRAALRTLHTETGQ